MNRVKGLGFRVYAPWAEGLLGPGLGVKDLGVQQEI